MPLRLLTIPFSHYCEKARWALDRARLPYQEEAHLPLIHYLYNHHHGAGQTVPALVTPEGVLNDSRDILNYVQRHGIPLYPAEYKNEVLSWETRFDAVLGPQVRVWAYWHILPERKLLKAIIQNGPTHESQLARPFLGVIRHLIAQKYGVTPQRGVKAQRDIDLIWNQVDHLLRDGRRYLVGERFTAADLTLAALGGVLLTPPEYGFTFPERTQLPPDMVKQVEIWESRPTGQHILEMYRQHRQITV